MNYRNRDWLKQKYWGENLSLTQMGVLAGVGGETIRNWMLRYTIDRRTRAEAIRLPAMRKKLSEAQRGEKHHNWGKKLSAATKRKMSEARQGEKNPNWKGGRVRQNGYILIKAPGHPRADVNGYVREHRLTVERALGRYLRADELVHHINSIRDDNRLENLQLVDRHRQTVCPRCGWPMENIQEYLDYGRKES